MSLCMKIYKHEFSLDIYMYVENKHIKKEIRAHDLVATFDRICVRMHKKEIRLETNENNIVICTCMP